MKTHRLKLHTAFFDAVASRIERRYRRPRNLLRTGALMPFVAFFLAACLLVDLFFGA